MIFRDGINNSARFNIVVVAAMIVVSPFIFYTGPGSFSLPRTVLFEMCACLLAISYLASPPEGVSPLRLPLLLFAAVYSFAAIRTGAPLPAIKTLALFIAGIVVAWCLAPVAAYQSRPRRLCAIITGVGFLMAIHGLFQFSGIDIPVLRAVQFRVFATAGTPASLSGWLAVSLCLLLPLIAAEWSPKRTLAMFAAWFVICLCLMLSSSRSGLAAAGVGLFVTSATMMFPTVSRPRGASVRVFLCALLMAISVFTMLFMYSYSDTTPFPDARPGLMRLQPSDPAMKKNSVRLRIFTLKCGFEMWEKHPFLGSGPGSFTRLYPLEQAKIVSGTGGANISGVVSHRLASHAHNEYIELAVEAGTLGLAAFSAIVLFFFDAMRRGITSSRRPSSRSAFCGVLGAVCALLMQSVFEFTLHEPLTAMLFWVLIGIGASTSAVTITRKARRSSSALSTAGIVACAILLMCAPAPIIAMSIANNALSREGARFERDIVPALDRAVSIDPASAELRLLQAKARRRTGDITGALEALSFARRLSNSPELYDELGRTHAAAGNFDEAETFFLKSLSIDPWMPSTGENILRLAILEHRTGRNSEAEQFLKRAADTASHAPEQRTKFLILLNNMRTNIPRR